MDLSIIVPVYNVERYIYTCVESLYKQGLDENDFEVIIVNDGSTDGSIDAINNIISKHSNITVLNQANQGLSSARNNGLLQAKGDYILFVDSDDFLIPDTVGDMLKEACCKKPDILIADFIKLTNEQIDNGSIPNKTPYSSTMKPDDTNTLALLNPQECYVWRSLYNKDFLLSNNIYFIPGVCFEDVPFSADCYMKAKKCIISKNVFYIYRQRPGSIVATIDYDKILDFNTIIEYLWNLRNKVTSSVDDKLIMSFIYKTHQLQTWFIAHDKTLLIRRKEITKDLRNKVPHLSFNGGIRENIESVLYHYVPNSYIWLRSIL